MPSRYKRKTDHRSSWTEDSLQNAILAVRKGMSVNKSAIEYGIPRRTLRDRLKNQNLGGPSPGVHCIFTTEQEKEIADYALLLSNLYYGISREDMCSLAYEYAVRNEIPNNFSKTKGIAGKVSREL